MLLHGLMDYRHTHRTAVYETYLTSAHKSARLFTMRRFVLYASIAASLMHPCRKLSTWVLLFSLVTISYCPRALLAERSLCISTTYPCRPNATRVHFKAELSSRRLLTDANSTTAHDSSTVEASAAHAQPHSHKPLTPVSSHDVVVFAIAGLVLFIAAGAGMGGGPVLVPIYLTLGAFSQQAAVALSNSTILAGSVANVLCNGRKRHPFKNRPLVDWDLILLMQPPTLLGAIAGSYVNKLLPGWISHVLLAILLTLMTMRVLQRAAVVCRKESCPEGQQAAAAGAGAGELYKKSAATDAPMPAAAAARELSRSPLAPEAASRQLGWLPAKSAGPGAASSSSSTSPARAGSTGRMPSISVAAAAGSTASLCSTAAAVAAEVGQRTVVLRVGSAPAPMTAAAPPLAAGALRLTALHPQVHVATPGSYTKPLAVAKTLAAAAHPHKAPRVSASDTVVQLTVLSSSSSRDGAAGAGPVVCCSSGRCSVERVASDGLSALAYAPPQHKRKFSWELQDDDWESDWEAWSEGGSPMVQHSSPAGDTAAAPGTHGASRLAFNSSGGGHGPTLQQYDTSQGGLLPEGHVSSSTGGAVQQQVQKPQELPPEVSAQSLEMQDILKAEAAALPLVPALLLLGLFAAVLVTSLTSKLAGCGTAMYWLAQFAVVPALTAIFWYSRRCVLRKVARKRAAQYDFHGDIRWTSKNSMLFPMVCSLSGMIAGMFGLGGAVVLTPLMLELGVQPQVTAATTQTMLLLTSAASTITYAQMGDIPWDYAAVLLPVAFAATFAGQIALDALVKKLGRTSLVVMVLAVFFVVACGLTYFVMVESLKVAAADVAAATVLGHICG